MPSMPTQKKIHRKFLKKKSPEKKMLLSKIIMIYRPQKSIKEPIVPQLLLQKLTWNSKLLITSTKSIY